MSCDVSRVLSLNGEEVEETEMVGLAADEQTLFCANVIGNKIIQVHVHVHVYIIILLYMYIELEIVAKVHVHVCFANLSEHSQLCSAIDLTLNSISCI